MINFLPWNLMTRLQWEAASWTANFLICLKKFNTLLAAKAVLIWFEINFNTNLRDISNLIDLGPMDTTRLAMQGRMLYNPWGCHGSMVSISFEKNLNFLNEKLKTRYKKKNLPIQTWYINFVYRVEILFKILWSKVKMAWLFDFYSANYFFKVTKWQIAL